MKTSNIILTAFFGVIGLFLLSFLIQVDEDKQHQLEIENEYIAVPAFNHLVVEKGANLIISEGVADTLKLSWSKEVNVSKQVYTTQGDTLIINPIPTQEWIYLELTCSQLKSVSVYDSRVDVKQMSLGNLQISGKDAQIQVLENATIDSLTVNLSSQSRLWSNNSNVRSVSLTMTASSADFNQTKTEELKANLQNNSELSVSKVRHSDILSDESSRYFSR